MTESQIFREAVKKLIESRFSSIPKEDRDLAVQLFCLGVNVGMEVAHDPSASLSDLVRARI